MAKNMYDKCKEMLECHKGKKATLGDLRALIMRNLGSDMRTINSAMRTMSECGMIKDDGSKFEVL